MALPLDDLSLLDGPGAFGSAPAAGGAPLQIALALIDEDPDQPRREFDESALRELADTIALRGVRQPVSVRPHPRDAGRWMLNFGARRFRASRLAGQATIPAFIDATADSFDQVIENEQRQRLTPLELALFVQRQQQAGQSLAEIGRRLGKSRTYMSFVAALIDAPGWLLQVYREGRCRGLTELYELRRLHDRDPAAAQALLARGDEISRALLAAARVQVVGEGAVEDDAGQAGNDAVARAAKGRPEPGGSMAAPAGSRSAAAGSSALAPTAPAASSSLASKQDARAELHAQWRDAPVRVRPDLLMTAEGAVIVERLDGTALGAAAIGELTDLRLVARDVFSGEGRVPCLHYKCATVRL